MIILVKVLLPAIKKKFPRLVPDQHPNKQRNESVVWMRKLFGAQLKSMGVDNLDINLINEKVLSSCLSETEIQKHLSHPRLGL